MSFLGKMFYNIYMLEHISFSNCLYRFFESKFISTLRTYVEGGLLQKHMGYPEGTVLVFEDLVYKKFTILKTEGAVVFFSAEFTFMYTINGHSPSKEEPNHKYSSICSWNIPLKENGLTMGDIEFDAPIPEREWSYGDDLVPFVKKEDYPKMAALFKKKVFGDKEPSTTGYFYATDVIKKLGLTMLSSALPNDCTGKIIMVDNKTIRVREDNGTISEKRVKAGTILFDSTKAALMSPSMMATTPLHECFHWVFHRCAFELGRLYRKSDEGFTCFNDNSAKGSRAAEGNKFIEIQTNGVVPYILASPEEICRNAHEISNEYKNSVMTRPEIIEATFNELRGMYNMSADSMRRCLVEGGLTAFRGICIYQDGIYLKSFCFKKEALGKGETFCIPRASMSRLFKEDATIRELVLGGDFVYADGHLVLNEPKFISFREPLTPELTEYALSHADECFMKFEISDRSENSSVCFDDGLNRVSKKMEGVYKAMHDKTLSHDERTEARRKWKEYIAEWRNCERRTFGETFKEIMKHFKKSANLFKERGLSQDQVYKLYKNGNKPQLKTLITIGGCLNMPYEVFIWFMEKAGADPYSSLPVAEKYLEFMDDEMLFSNIAEFDEELKRCGFDPLSKPSKAK